MTTNKNLATKLVRVMANVKNVAKNGRNDHHRYDYVTERDVIEAVRENLIKENVFLLSSVEGSHREGTLTSIIMKHTFIDADSGETLEVKSLGTGSDSQDKGAYKAYTGAIKYMLQKLFLIPTGDDPEATDEKGKTTASPVAAVATANTSAPVKGKFGFSNRPKPGATAQAEKVDSNDDF